MSEMRKETSKGFTALHGRYPTVHVDILSEMAAELDVKRVHLMRIALAEYIERDHGKRDPKYKTRLEALGKIADAESTNGETWTTEAIADALVDDGIARYVLEDPLPT